MEQAGLALIDRLPDLLLKRERLPIASGEPAFGK
jgi:hypothetical protein